jgi:two-component system, sensor histidine kinase RegB
MSMFGQDFDRLHLPQRRQVRLDTLVRLRWFAIIGQTIAVLVVYTGLDFELPIWPCLAVITLSTWLNIALRYRFSTAQRLEPDRAAWLLAFDTAELAALLFLTGGLQNPFAFLFLAPVLLSASALPPRLTLILGGFAMLLATLLLFVHYKLPWWEGEDQLELPWLYMLGVWLSILLSILFIGLYSWQMTEEGRQLAEALAATELVLEREQHLSQLDGLAAAAAHELGTPLSTISIIARELERTMPPDAPYADDVRLLREQSQRCRSILAKLTELSASGEPFDRMPLSALIEEVVAPHRNFGIAIDVALPQQPAQPVGARNPAILYGLGNLLENAVDFAQKRVEVIADWSGDDVAVTISDDGPGFAPEILDRIGEPYVRSSKRRRMNTGGETTGLGLGFFIAKTLLERSGATLDFENRAFPDRGAVVRIQWGREDFERPLTVAVS